MKTASPLRNSRDCSQPLNQPKICAEITCRDEFGGVVRGSNKPAFKDNSNPNPAKRRASSSPAILAAADHRISGHIPNEF